MRKNIGMGLTLVFVFVFVQSINSFTLAYLADPDPSLPLPILPIPAPAPVLDPTQSCASQTTDLLLCTKCCRAITRWPSTITTDINWNACLKSCGERFPILRVPAVPVSLPGF